MPDFIQHYLEYASFNESPETFNIYTAYSLLSTLAEGRVYTRLPRFTNKIKLNTYIMLVNKAGRRKSASLYTALPVIDCINKHFKENPITVGPSNISDIALARELQDNAKDGDNPIVLFASEFKQLIQASGDKLIALLTEVYDGKKHVYKSIAQDIIPIESPSVTLLGCVTTETIKHQLNTQLIDDGFTRRVLFIVEDEYRKQPLNISIQEIAKRDHALEACVKLGKSIYKLSGEVTYTDKAFRALEKWYAEQELSDNAFESNFQSSELMQICKLACLRAIARLSLEATFDDVRAAIAELEAIKPRMFTLFKSVGKNIAASVKQEILDYITKHGKVSKKEVLERWHNSVEHITILNQTLVFMLEADLIQESYEDVKIQGKTYKKVYYEIC